MKAQEKEDLKKKRSLDAVETTVALDALAVYVNDKSPLQEISLPQLAKIYTGETTNWKDVGGADKKITTYGRENSSGTYAYFKEHVLANKDFAPAVQTLAGTSAVANAVKGDENGIGYGGIAYLEGVRALKVKKDDAATAVAASLQTAQDGTYPLARPMCFVLNIKPGSAAQPVLQDFIRYCMSYEGQRDSAIRGDYPVSREMTAEAYAAVGITMSATTDAPEAPKAVGTKTPAAK